SPAPPTTESYTLSLHDALPIYAGRAHRATGAKRPDHAPTHALIEMWIKLLRERAKAEQGNCQQVEQSKAQCSFDHRLWSPSEQEDRKSTRLNSSHVAISYAVFC